METEQEATILCSQQLKKELKMLACLHGNLRDAAKAIVTAGLKWPPETCPSVYIITITIIPHPTAMPMTVSRYFLSISTHPQPANMIT